MSEALLSRLETAVRRLEEIGVRGGGGGKAGGAAEQKTVRFVEEYQTLHNGIIAQFIATCNKLDVTKSIGEAAEKGFQNLLKVVTAMGQCKKPSDAELQAFIKPISEVVQAAQNADNRSPAFNHQKAWGETSQIFFWVAVPTAVGQVEAALEASDFYLNKILLQAKNEADATKAGIFRDYRNQTRALIEQLTEYVRTHHKMGASWNPKGSALADFHDGGAVPAAPEAPEAPPAPEAPEAPDAPDAPDVPQGGGGGAGGAAGGLAAVFAQINAKGEGGVTQGLKHVTKDMKTKNLPKDAPAPAPKAAPSYGAPKTEHKAAPAVKKDPVVECRKGTWFVEYHDGKNHELKGVEMKENVYIMKCNNATISITGKVKSIQVETCTNLNIIFDAVVSTFEIVNSKKCKIFCKEYCPAVAIDKSQGVSVILQTPESLKEIPKIVTSMTSELNLVVPGKTEQDDPVEIPLSEQFQHVYDRATGKVLCEPVKHSAA